MFEEVIATHTVYILPAQLNDLLGGIRRQLDRHLFRHSSRLDGIPIAFTKVELLSNASSSLTSTSSLSVSGPLHGDDPCVPVGVRVLWTVLVVRRGISLIGQVSWMGREQVGLVVLGHFTTFIAASHLEAAGWRWISNERSHMNDDNDGEDAGRWCKSSSKKANIINNNGSGPLTKEDDLEVGQYLTFTVLDVQTASSTVEGGSMLTITGSLPSPDEPSASPTMASRKKLQSNGKNFRIPDNSNQHNPHVPIKRAISSS